MGRGHEARRRQRQPPEARLYELNLWMWRYGRGQERKVTVLQAMEARARTVREARVRAGETAKRRRLAAREATIADAAA